MSATTEGPVGEGGKTKPALVDTEMSFNASQKKMLKNFVKRGVDIEAKSKELKSLKSALLDQVDENGFDRKIVKRVIAERATPKEDREYEQQQFEFYLGIVAEDDDKTN